MITATPDTNFPFVVKSQVIINKCPVVAVPYVYFGHTIDFNIFKVLINERNAAPLVFNMYAEKTAEERIIHKNNLNILRAYFDSAGYCRIAANLFIAETEKFYKAQLN